ncbi:MAG: bifunctional phosphoribosyl-AMP cyclohydrolase/phosphoribosyl-ATP diphosphatase HisIE [bacterium]
MIDIDILDFDKLDGLIPAIIVDNNTNQILMLGFMNKEALSISLETKKVTFYSRTRQSLWVKGETSGNYLNMINVVSDCDNDTLIVYVNPVGVTCHTGEYSCFNLPKSNLYFLEKLFDLIKERKLLLPENSYTTKLFKQGENRIIQKVGEEAIETVIAAKNNDKEEIINEVSDLFFHLFVMLADKGIELNDITENLLKRHK